FPPSQSGGHPRTKRGLALSSSCLTDLLYLATESCVLQNRNPPSSSQGSRNAQPLHFGNECRALESESGRGAFETSDDPVGLSQSLNDVFTLGILQCEPGTGALSRNVRE